MNANKYAGKCWYCGQPLGPWEGLTYRRHGKHVVIHPNCEKARHEAKVK